MIALQDDEHELASCLRKTTAGGSSSSTSNGASNNSSAEAGRGQHQWEKISEEEEGSWTRRVFILKDPAVSWVSFKPGRMVTKTFRRFFP